jgi:hypothetical protein
MDSSSVNGLSECQFVCICRIASHEVRFRKLAREPFLNHSERIVGHSDNGGCKPDRSPEVGFPSAWSLWRKACRNHLVWHAVSGAWRQFSRVVANNRVHERCTPVALWQGLQVACRSLPLPPVAAPLSTSDTERLGHANELAATGHWPAHSDIFKLSCTDRLCRQESGGRTKCAEALQTFKGKRRIRSWGLLSPDPWDFTLLMPVPVDYL